MDPFADATAPSAHVHTAHTTVAVDKHAIIFPPNSIMDLRRKLAKATGIPIYCQHIYTPEYEPVGYEIIVDSPIIVNISDIISGGPISHKRTHWRGPMSSRHAAEPVAAPGKIVPDEILAGYGRDNIRVRQHETQTMLQLVALHGYEYFVADMRLWVTSDVIAECADETHRELVYWGFIVKYWPLLTYGAWSAYCTGRISEYPDLETRGTYDSQNTILAHMYDLGPEVNTAIASGHVQLNVRGASVNMFGTANINLRALFEALRCTPAHPILYLGHAGMRVLKLLRTPAGTHETTYEGLRAQFRMGLVVVLGAAAGRTLVITFSTTGYTITGSWTQPITLDAAIDELRAGAAPIIAECNALGRAIFTSQLRLTYIAKWMHLSAVELQLVWTRQLSSVQYAALADVLLEDSRAKIIEHYDGAYYYKLGVAFEPQVDPPANGYAYLTDLHAKEAWAASRRGLLLEFAHRTTAVSATVYGLSRHDLPYWYSYVLWVFARLAAVRGVADTQLGTASLKSLKARDPELFNPRVGKSIIYSRLCQKSHQPSAYTPAEYENLPGEIASRAVAYWNFTTNTPMYYACSGTKYPHMTFITGKHPQGYCLPCCKKTQQNAEMHRTCIEEHTWTSATSIESRYIMNYGRRIDPGRLGKLPDPIEKYLMYHSLSIDANAAVPNKRGRPPTGSATRTSHFLYGTDGSALATIAHALGAKPADYAQSLHAALKAAGHPQAADFHALHVAGREVLADFSQLLLDSPRYFGAQTIILHAGMRIDDLHIERLHNNSDPIICVFARTIGATTFATSHEYYPIYQINNFAYFRDASIDAKVFSPVAPASPNESQALAYRFANILLKLSSPDALQFTLYQLQSMIAGSGYEVVEQIVDTSGRVLSAVVSANAETPSDKTPRSTAKAVELASDKISKKGGGSGDTSAFRTVVPLHLQPASGTIPQRGTYRRRECASRGAIELFFTATGGRLQLRGEIVYAGSVIGGECYAGDVYVGYMYHTPYKHVRAPADATDPEVTLLQYDPDDVNAAFNDKTSVSPCEYENRDYSSKVVVPVMSHLDAVRNAPLRALLGRPTKLLEELQVRDFFDDYEFVEFVQHSGYYPDQQAQILREHIYQFDRERIRKLPTTPGPTLRGELKRIMEAAKVPAALRARYIDVLMADFCNPIKRDYFNRGIYADHTAEPWRFTQHDAELMMFL